ncbi:uncharacterized protein ARMOST_01235 [Armillaria ostoyae]|uniref:Uncharacterized protein n=1 Tax=Armillaria ostoyae TaxID=47428 RepID=A0A284QND3_ARMOS|nr:uncharacterized protein ARMOST_01235 [Armillaria ostoyae]
MVTLILCGVSNYTLSLLIWILRSWSRGLTDGAHVGVEDTDSLDMIRCIQWDAVLTEARTLISDGPSSQPFSLQALNQAFCKRSQKIKREWKGKVSIEDVPCPFFQSVLTNKYASALFDATGSGNVEG